MKAVYVKLYEAVFTHLQMSTNALGFELRHSTLWLESMKNSKFYRFVAHYLDS